MPRLRPRRRSPCGACIVLHAQCTSLCFFAPFFSHEEGVTDFSAIHRVFGAMNASILLARVPTRDRSEAAITLTIEALARLQDPAYGCVSYILALQQQVSDLLTYRALLQQFVNYYAHPQPIPDWPHPQPNPNQFPENTSLPSFPEASYLPYHTDASSSQGPHRDDIDELGPVVFGNHRRH